MHQADTERTIAHLILIGGGTCSGKTTIARAIGKKIGDTGTVIISHDNYYLDLSHLSEEESKNINFDHPDAIDHEYLLSDVRKMLGGKSVRIPDYNFITHKRTEGTTFVDKADVIILEGIFALYYARLLGLADLKIFVDTDADLRLARRIRRDIQERGYEVQTVLQKYQDTVKPMHEAFIEPTKKNADFIVPGEREFDRVLGMLKSYLKYEIVNKK
jgi:uridine kinase